MGRELRRRAGWRGPRGAGTRLRVLGAGSRCPNPLHPLRSQRALCRLALGRREQPGPSPCLLLRAASIPDWPVWVRKPWRLALIWDGPEHLRDGLRPLSRPPRRSVSPTACSCLLHPTGPPPRGLPENLPHPHLRLRGRVQRTKPRGESRRPGHVRGAGIRALEAHGRHPVLSG